MSKTHSSLKPVAFAVRSAMGNRVRHILEYTCGNRRSIQMHKTGDTTHQMVCSVTRSMT